jgi:hypothetical protein
MIGRVRFISVVIAWFCDRVGCLVSGFGGLQGVGLDDDELSEQLGFGRD